MGLEFFSECPRKLARILITVHKFFPANKAGTEVLTLKIATELKRRGHEILVVSADPPAVDARHATGPEWQDYEYEGIKVHAIGESLRLKNYSYEHEFLHPEIGDHFDNILEEFKPDLVHVMHAQNLSAEVITRAKSRGLRVIFSPTDFWFICPIVQLKRSDGTICEGPGPQAEHCISCYTPELIPSSQQFVEAVHKRLPVTKLLGKTLTAGIGYETYVSKKRVLAEAATRKRPEVLREIGNSVDAITVPTEIMKTLFIKNGFDESLIEKVPFGIDTSKLESFQEKVPADTLRVGFIGTIYEHKGLDILLKAFQLLPGEADAVLKVYGNTEQFPDYAAEILELADRSSIHKEKIQFLGTFANDKLGEVLTEIDVLVVPSRWYENTPLVIQSALATRTPLIATDLGGMSELVKSGENGLLFKLNDEEDLARQLESILHDRSKLLEFRKNIGPQRTVLDMVNDLERLYFA